MRAVLRLSEVVTSPDAVVTTPVSANEVMSIFDIIKNLFRGMGLFEIWEFMIQCSS